MRSQLRPVPLSPSCCWHTGFLSGCRTCQVSSCCRAAAWFLRGEILILQAFAKMSPQTDSPCDLPFKVAPLFIITKSIFFSFFSHTPHPTGLTHPFGSTFKTYPESYPFSLSLPPSSLTQMTAVSSCHPASTFVPFSVDTEPE